MELLQNFYQNKNVLITGGAGFIGSHIAQELCKLKANVTIIDDLSTGSIENLESFCHDVNFIAGDITSFKSCVRATKKQAVIFHTAAFVSVSESVKNPAICEKINAEGTQTLLEASAINNVKSFVFSSSAAVYGEKNLSCKEDNKPEPKSPYAKSKLTGEKLCKEYSKKYKISTSCLRYFNVYGERQNPFGPYAGVVAKFKHNLINKEPIIIYGNGKQRRDFIHVSKVAQANLLMGTIPYLNGEVFNIATGKSIDLFQLIKKLEKEVLISLVNIRFKPARKGDIIASMASCDKYKSAKNEILNGRSGEIGRRARFRV